MRHDRPQGVRGITKVLEPFISTLESLAHLTGWHETDAVNAGLAQYLYE